MAKRALREKPLHQADQFSSVSDVKLRKTLFLMADRYSEQARNLIRKTYQDQKLHEIYRGIRASGKYQRGGASLVHRKIIEFPNQYVYDFVDTVMSATYGDDWLEDNRALRHDLVKPWLVVDKL